MVVAIATGFGQPLTESFKIQLSFKPANYYKEHSVSAILHYIARALVCVYNARVLHHHAAC